MIARTPFGFTAEGGPVHRYSMRDEHGCGADFLDYGCIIQSLFVRDRLGAIRDVCLGYDTVEGYEQNGDYMGAVLGRCANRIAGAKFVLDGRTHCLSANDGRHHIHGGAGGFHRRIWEAEPLSDEAIRFFRRSAQGEEGYPGNLDVSVEYAFHQNCLRIDYRAVADADTVVSLSNHTYFDLSGGMGDAMAHWLLINAERFAENDREFIPTGRLLPVLGTPFDFRKGRKIADCVDAPHEQLERCGGLDHDFSLEGADPAALLWHEHSGIRMTVRTDMPSLEVYTANSLPGDAVGKYGRVLRRRSGICLETQHFPNAIRCDGFPSPILRKGNAYRSKTHFIFDIVEI